MRAALIVLACVATALSAIACDETPTAPDGVGTGTPIDQSATFTRVQNEVFTPTCAQLACHDRIGAQSAMILTADVAFQSIVNVRSIENPNIFRIAPNDVANSYLYRKITGSGISGDRMPQGLPPLDQAKITLIRDWIRRGAPRD